MSILPQVAIYLGAAVIAVPLSKRLGLGALLGYLIAGMIIGPGILGLIGEVEQVLHFAELGVVLLLFIIGLELNPQRLWSMRKTVFGLGTLQLLITAAVLSAVALLLGLSWRVALLVGLGLALSSTAVGLQLLAEKKQLGSAHGQAAFGVLLLQDVAIVPLMVLVPVLAGGSMSLDLALLKSSALAVGALLGLAFAGRYLLRPLFRAIADSQVHEIFTAAALLVVVGTGLLMQAVGFSMAMGAFVAGVLLSDSEYRHELEANIEPFKSLLLGLFFIAVGMSVNLGLVISQPVLIFGLTFLFLALKFVVLYVLGRLNKLDHSRAMRFGISIFQGGEFAFVLFGLAKTDLLINSEQYDILIVMVSFSILLTPIAVNAYDYLTQKRSIAKQPEFDQMENEGNRVIIAGFGRFGQIIGRLLSVRKIPFTALDTSPGNVDFVRKFGNKIFFGDPQRLDLLRAAGVEQADIFVIALDDVQASNNTARLLKKNFPHLKIYARARNRQHVHDLNRIGIKHTIRETFLSSLEMGEDVLRALNISISAAAETVARFKDYDRELMNHEFEHYDDPERRFISGRHSRIQLQELFEKDSELLMKELDELKGN